MTSIPLSDVDTEKKIDGKTFWQYTARIDDVIRDATAAGVKGESYVHHFITKGRFNGKTVVRYKPLNNMDLYEFAKQKYARNPQ